jgi:hypothetical protein
MREMMHNADVLGLIYSMHYADAYVDAYRANGTWALYKGGFQREPRFPSHELSYTSVVTSV